MDPKPAWQLWFNRRGKLKGIAIVHRCSDYALELHECLTQEGDRIEYAKKLCKVLNEAKV